MGEKQKIQGVDNKELKAFVGIIAVLILLLVFEIFFFKGSPAAIEEQQKSQALLEEIQSVTVENEQKKVYKALNNVISMMNNKEYKELYDILRDDYKNCYFREYENFENFIKAYAGQEYYPKYSSYYRAGNLYYVIVDFLKAKYTREDLLSLRPTKVDTIVLEEQGDGSFKFAMHGFIETIEHNKSKTVDGLEVTMHSSVRNTESQETTFFFLNNSNKTVSISTNNIELDIAGGMPGTLSVTSSITLAPGEIGSLDMEYYLEYNSNKEFRGVTIKGINFDDGSVIEDFYLAK